VLCLMTTDCNCKTAADCRTVSSYCVSVSVRMYLVLTTRFLPLACIIHTCITNKHPENSRKNLIMKQLNLQETHTMIRDLAHHLAMRPIVVPHCLSIERWSPCSRSIIYFRVQSVCDHKAFRKLSTARTWIKLKEMKKKNETNRPALREKCLN